MLDILTLKGGVCTFSRRFHVVQCIEMMVEGQMWKWTLNPKLPDMLILNWENERGMDYMVQSSSAPQKWIRKHLGEHEVPRVDELFPTGLAWDSMSESDDGDKPDDGALMDPIVVGGSVLTTLYPGKPHTWHLSTMRLAAGGSDPEDRPWWQNSEESETSRGIRIDPSKKMVLFRVIAMPE